MGGVLCSLLDDVSLGLHWPRRQPCTSKGWCCRVCRHCTASMSVQTCCELPDHHPFQVSIIGKNTDPLSWQAEP